MLAAKFPNLATISIPDKTIYYSFSSPSDLQLFLDTLAQMRQEAVKHSMGHSLLPLTAVEERLDRESATKWRRRQRVAKRVREGEMRGRDEQTERLLS